MSLRTYERAPDVQMAETTDSCSCNLQVVRFAAHFKAVTELFAFVLGRVFEKVVHLFAEALLSFPLEGVCTRLCLLLRRVNAAADHRARGRLLGLDLTQLLQNENTSRCYRTAEKLGSYLL